ncbi:MAG: hypothetical protein AAF501_09180 [Pseudomonadota bacterium]
MSRWSTFVVEPGVSDGDAIGVLQNLVKTMAKTRGLGAHILMEQEHLAARWAVRVADPG